MPRRSRWPAVSCDTRGRSLTWLHWGALIALCLVSCVHGMTDELVRELRQETRDIFYHGFNNYMIHAFPEDELRPLTCGPLTRDRENPAHIELNDVLGNYSLTLIDSLSTLAILASTPPENGRRNTALNDFQDGIARIVEFYGDGTSGPKGQGIRARGFDLDSKVQVFETVIRGVGGLVSAHQFAVGDLPIRGYVPDTKTDEDRTVIKFSNGLQYDGQLLRLAQDLAERLLPAFYTPTGLPYPRVNLRYGIPFYANSVLNNDAENGECPLTPPPSAEITETCTAGAGSLVLEFSTLSRLTGDSRYEDAAKEAFWAVWHRRSSVGLVGSGIDAETGQWVSPFTGIGAGIDSFFEYAMKSHILLSGLPAPANDSETQTSEDFLDAWQNLHAAIQRHVYRDQVYQHPHYIQSDLYTGAMRAFWIDSLSAYYPGLLTLAGELDEAITTHLLYTALWTRYSALPERWSTATGNIEMGLRWWGGRPEFIESTWYLYRATKDPWYLHVGEMALRDIKRRCWTKCGWAGIQDVRTGEQTDRMESFFLGETAKYLFLLFDREHPLNHLDAPWVLTTEGHPLIIPKRLRKSSQTPATRHRGSVDTDTTSTTEPAPTCPAAPELIPFSLSATAARTDYFHAASLARLHLVPSLENISSPLFDFTTDHPSISISDLQSPTNYTYYPWTLPAELIPANGTCSKMAHRATFDLTFPNLPNGLASFATLRRTGDGILVGSMSGLRLGMIRDGGGSGHPDDIYRIQAVSNVMLGRDEKVYIKRDTMEDFNPVDPFFTRSKDTTLVELVLDTVPTPVDEQPLPTDAGLSTEAALEYLNASMPVDITPEDLESSLTAILEQQETLLDEDGSFFSSLLDTIQSLLASSTSVNREPLPSHPPALQRVDLTATLSIGPGAAPLPDVPDASIPTDSTLNAEDTQSQLTWRTIYVVDDDLCAEPTVPASVVRQHQILVVPRGGCSFSTKLQHIPVVPPSPSSVQLVVIVSFPEHEVQDYYVAEQKRLAQQRGGKAWEQQPRDFEDGSKERMDALVQPLLEGPQLTPKGMPRPHPLPMVMVGGGEATMALFRNTAGVGLRRKFWFSTQGVRIGNLYVL